MLIDQRVHIRTRDLRSFISGLCCLKIFERATSNRSMNVVTQSELNSADGAPLLRTGGGEQDEEFLMAQFALVELHATVASGEPLPLNKTTGTLFVTTRCECASMAGHSCDCMCASRTSCDQPTRFCLCAPAGFVDASCGSAIALLRAWATAGTRAASRSTRSRATRARSLVRASTARCVDQIAMNKQTLCGSRGH